MVPLEDACQRYAQTLATTPWAKSELYKLEWACELAARVDWRHSDEAICGIVIELLGRRFGYESSRGINFLQIHRRYGQAPLITPDIIGQIRRCAHHDFADLPWTPDGIPYPVISCYVATLFPERLRPIHNAKFAPLFEYLFPERYEPPAHNGRQHVVDAQPYLESIALELERIDAARFFIEARDEYRKEHGPGALDTAETNGRLLSNWVAQDFCYYMLFWMGETNAAGVSREVPELHPDEAEEGERRLSMHHRRERDSRLARRAKARAREIDPTLPCEACGESFLRRYGPAGEGVIEAHHVEPLGERPASGRTRIEDFVMLCADCHTMVHRTRPATSVETLRFMLADALR